MSLAAYACHPAQSRGRRFAEPPAPTRTAFARDRDRIVHSTAFRRLVYKTQVFLNHEGDLFRTRLTHSLEVAQLARSIARTLKLNEDLVEAIALAHDLGHTPFGHAGQDALNGCMKDYGGFEHNLQSLRVVDDLEARYPQYNGLNLSFETREGILKHCSRTNAKRIEASEPGGVAQRFLDHSGSALQTRSPSLEAQLCNLADNIAYNAHDIDDGVRSGLLSLEQLRECRLFETYRLETLSQYPQLTGRRLLNEAIRRMLSAQVYDVIAATTANIAQVQPKSVEQVRQSRVLVQFSDDMHGQSTQLNRFLLVNLYRHPQVLETTQRAQNIVVELFDAYCHDSAQMQADFASRADNPGPEAASHVLQREVADYIAGMTDRFAAREHERLTGRQLFPGRQVFMDQPA